MTIRALSACLLVLAALSASAAEFPPVRTTEGPVFAAELEGVHDNKVTFRTSEGPRTVALAELVHWSYPVEARRGPQVLLADGSLLVGQPIEIVRQNDSDQFRMLADKFGDVRLPLATVRGVLLAPPTQRAERDRITASLRTANNQTDELLLRNGDRLSGTIAGLADDQLTIRTALGEVQLPIGKIQSIALAATDADPAEKPSEHLRTRVGFRDGSLVVAESLDITPGSVRLQLADGTELTSQTPQAVVSLQPTGGTAVYVSDLPSHTYQHIPFLDLKWPLHTDRNVLGTQLRSAGQLYAKGLGMHSAARATYLLPGEFRLFQSELALDDTAGRQGSVIFRVFKSDGGDWQELFASPVVRGGEPPGSMSVDIRGATAIALAVDFAEHGDVLDHANWLNARLIK